LLQEANVKQHYRLSRRNSLGAALLGLALILMSACAPTAAVQSGVVPMVISTSAKDNQLVIQGRYFGSGTGGAEAGNYVLAGADAQGQGGFMLEADTWTPTRITAAIPQGTDLRFVFVVVDGQRSTGLSVNQR
jgi:hypothetical protein